mgnify:CR=1 FL=1
MDVSLHRLLNNLLRDKTGVDPRNKILGCSIDQVAAEDDPDVLRLENIDTKIRPLPREAPR